MRIKTYSENINDAVSGIIQRGETVIDHFWNIIEHGTFPVVTLNSTTNGARQFPVYNVIENKESDVTLEIAVSGYTRDRLTIEREGNVLIVKGIPFDDKDVVYRKRGVSNSAFLRTFDLHQDAIIKSVTLVDGLLKINIVTKVTTEPKETFPIQ